MSDVNIKVSVNDSGASAKVGRLTKNFDQSQKSVDRLNVSIRNSTSAFKVFAGNVAAIGFTKLVSSVGSLVSSSIKVTGEIETLATQFEVLTGSAGMANKAIADLQQFAANTPFQFAELAKAQQGLLAFGFTLDESQERLKVLGDVAAASGANIGELSTIYGQVAAAGKLTGERLLQLQERAIPIGPALANALGVAESSVRDLVSKGAVDLATFEKAFASLNQNGQFAFEGMIKRSATLEGRISTLSDNFQLMQATIGSKLGPAMKALVTTLTLFIQRIQNSAAFTQFLETIGNKIPTAIEFAIDSLQFVINTVMNVVKIFNLFRSGVTTALSTVIQAFTGFIDIYTNVINALGLGDTAIGRGLNSIKGLRDGVVTALDDTAAGFAQSAAEIGMSQEKVNAAIDQGKKFVLDSLAEETAAAEAQANAKIGSDQKKIDSIKALSAEEQKALDERLAREAKLAETLAAARNELAIAEEEERLLRTEREVLFTDERLLRMEEAFTREEEAAIQAKINMASTEQEKQIEITKALAQGTKNRYAIQQKAKEDELKLEQEKNRQILSSAGGALGSLAALARQGGAKQFKTFQALAKAQAVVNGVAAVSEAARQPFPINIPLTIKAVAESASRISAINSARPSFEQGGIVPGTSFTGDRVAANVNSGEMILNRQQQSRLFAMANNGSGGGGQEVVVPVTVEIDGEVIGRTVSRQVANGLKLGEVQ